MSGKEIKRPVLRYHGGKYILAKWIISHFPDHRVYVELFGGGGSVLIQKPKVYSEVYNDMWDTVVNVFRVLRDPINAKELERLLRLTPFSRTEFMETGEIDLAKIIDPVEKARLTILRSFAGFGSASTNNKYTTGFRANANRSGSTPANDWANYPNFIELFTERLSGVIIENKDYASILEQQDSEDTLFYADPPYVHATRNMKRGNAAYEHEFTDKDHRQMCRNLNAVKGMVLISGYDNHIYDKHLKGWHKEYKDTFADGAGERIEVLWINKNAQKRYSKNSLIELING